MPPGNDETPVSESAAADPITPSSRALPMIVARTVCQRLLTARSVRKAAARSGAISQVTTG